MHFFVTTRPPTAKSPWFHRGWNRQPHPAGRALDDTTSGLWTRTATARYAQDQAALQAATTMIRAALHHQPRDRR